MTLIWKEAQEKAEEFRSILTDPKGNFELKRLCELLKLQVNYTTSLPENTSGIIVRTSPNSPARIYINSNETRQRQRFTLAHEIGHYIERQTLAGDGDYSFHDRRDSNNYDLHEFYADQFAGALLMPRAHIRKLCPDLTNEAKMSELRDFAHIVSEEFDVSFSAALKRLERLQKQQELTE